VDGERGRAAVHAADLDGLAPAICRHRPHDAAAVVGEEVRPLHLGDARAACDHAAGDRAALVVRVRGDRQHGPGRRAAVLVAAVALQAVPPEVAAARHHVDLLDGALAHVAYPQVARLAIEGHAPWVAEAVGPDFAAPAARG